MYRYVLRRLLLTIPVILGAIFLVFTIMSLTPGDPGTLILGMTADKEDIEALNRELGYDKPFLVRFFNYLADIIFRFDFGDSYRTRTPVFQEIFQRFPNTFYLAVGSMALSSILGISLGISQPCASIPS